MRALTVKQPWASLIMAGVKDVENRSWPVPSTLSQWFRCFECGERRYRGTPKADRPSCPNPRPLRKPIANCWTGEDDGPFPFRLGIHAARAADMNAAEAWRTLYDHLRAQGIDDPQRWCERDEFGAFYGVLLGYVTVTGCHHSDDCWELRGAGEVVGPAPDGWFCSPWAEPDVYHWAALADPEPLPEPIPMRGMLGLWRLPDPLARTQGVPAA